jgi:hypothetical protein
MPELQTENLKKVILKYRKLLPKAIISIRLLPPRSRVLQPPRVTKVPPLPAETEGTGKPASATHLEPDKTNPHTQTQFLEHILQYYSSTYACTSQLYLSQVCTFKYRLN